jgi:hypothetical protein
VTCLTGISDIHIYYLQTNETQVKYAKELWERIRRECKLTVDLIRLYKAQQLTLASPRTTNLQALGGTNRTSSYRHV